MYYAYEQRTKKTLDLQGNMMSLEKKILELEAVRPKETGESLKVQGSLVVQFHVVPYTHQGQPPQTTKIKSKVEEGYLKEVKDLKE